eukprot:4562698-Pleurochrysis_carterae.AAC.1
MAVCTNVAMCPHQTSWLSNVARLSRAWVCQPTSLAGAASIDSIWVKPEVLCDGSLDSTPLSRSKVSTRKSSKLIPGAKRKHPAGAGRKTTASSTSAPRAKSGKSRLLTSKLFACLLGDMLVTRCGTLAVLCRLKYGSKALKGELQVVTDSLIGFFNFKRLRVCEGQTGLFARNVTILSVITDRVHYIPD